MEKIIVLLFSVVEILNSPPLEVFKARLNGAWDDHAPGRRLKQDGI